MATTNIKLFTIAFFGLFSGQNYRQTPFRIILDKKKKQWQQQK